MSSSDDPYMSSNRSLLARYSRPKMFDPSGLDTDWPQSIYTQYLVEKPHAI
jgi:hypothetical protein